MNSSTFLGKVKKILVSTLAAGTMMFAIVLPAFADTVGPINFEGPAYTTGNINGQQNWMKTGSYDVAVTAVSGFSNASGFGFDTQALRLSNAETSGSFGDQTFSPGLSSPAGEGLANKHFEASFDIGSTQVGQQTGLFLSVSPDDGNGSRMSYVGFEDQSDGIHVIFYDVTNPGPSGAVASFNSHDIATINRTSKHNIKFVIDFVPGSGNDVVKLYVDGALKATGTSWEDYYRFDPEQSGNGNVVPTTSKLLFREGGTPAPDTSGNGYLVDNVSLSSSPALVGPPTTIDQCKKGGWQTFNNPTFTDQGNCVSYTRTHAHSILGNIKYTAGGLARTAQFAVDSSDSSPGAFQYSDANHAWYRVLITSMKVSGHDGWFAGKVFQASNHAWVGQWLFVRVNDSSPRKIWGSFTTQANAESGVTSMESPADGPFTTSGALIVH